MFDVGFTEVLLLSLIGLMVLGPERLPLVARTLGRLAQKARASWLSLKRQVEVEMRAEDLKQPLHHFGKEVGKTVDDLKKSANAAVNPDKKTGEAEKPDSDRD